MTALLVPISFILAASPMQQLTRGLFDQTFAGIHQLGWFDWSLLVPYFALLGIVSIYGLHRYEIIRLYLKQRKRLPDPPRDNTGPLPRVTIQLPLYNERFVVERLIEAVASIDYPRDLLQIQVLDDSTDETRGFAESLVASHSAQGLPIEYHHRQDRHGFKAGALQNGLKTATGELIAIFDADFVPSPDFLKRTVHSFADPSVGVVQTRWSYFNRHSNLLTEIQAMLLDGHFVLEHAARQGSGLFFNFNGTAGILRRRMIDDAGGWQHDTLTEDSDLSYRAQLKGWRFVYLSDIECPSELPVGIHGFQVQQSRWAKGLTQVARKMLPEILRAKLSPRVKLEAFLHLTPNITYPLMIVVSALILPVMIVRFYVGWFQLLCLDLPLITATFCSISAFYVLAHKELYPNRWKRSILLIPSLLAVGVGLTVINTRAVLEALFGVESGFIRTPKYGSQSDGHSDRYRRKSGWLPYVEIAIGTYFLSMVAFAIETYNFLSIPFISLFVVGYYWAGFATLYHEFHGRLRWQRQRRLGMETAR